ncbi:hypothetical protein K435DRAFT_179999 [Dendrothele bispora CBS 962.96]|uniref:DUF6534 domain-containing protein n=1 Tax=Dendrothele bispora (strain CBS 962.96) TaxID=1314807 RepID=A0A4S8LWC5_DENBC|nr:hypothetical protein K435DRAFT_179999 [Dendrothele bispora CBS 962.96]
MSNKTEHLVERQYGPLLIGVFFNAILYGMLIVQAYVYFHQTNSDSRWTRRIIIILLIAETMNTGLNFGIVWEPLIENFGDFTTDTPLMLATNPVTTSFISATVQIYAGWRIRVLTRSNLLAGFILFLALLSVAAGITSSVYLSLQPSFVAMNEYIWALMAWLTSSAACDVVISVSLVRILVKHKNESLIQTKSVINKIIILTIQTGIITSVAAVAAVLAFIVQKAVHQHATTQLIWDLSLSKLYTNSLLSALNARTRLNKMIDAQNGPSHVCYICFDSGRVPDDSERSRKVDVSFNIGRT